MAPTPVTPLPIFCCYTILLDRIRDVLTDDLYEWDTTRQAQVLLSQVLRAHVVSTSTFTHIFASVGLCRLVAYNAAVKGPLIEVLP